MFPKPKKAREPKIMRKIFNLNVILLPLLNFKIGAVLDNVSYLGQPLKVFTLFKFATSRDLYTMSRATLRRGKTDEKPTPIWI